MQIEEQIYRLQDAIENKDLSCLMQAVKVITEWRTRELLQIEEDRRQKVLKGIEQLIQEIEPEQTASSQIMAEKLRAIIRGG